MAITIEQQPAENWLSTYNPIDYLVSSDNVTEPSFRYRFDIYINGVLERTYYVPIHPVYENGFMDISNVVESFLKWDFDTGVTDAGVVNCPNSTKTVYVSFGEQYEVAGVITDFPGLEDSDEIIITNASLNQLQWYSIDWDSYIHGGGLGVKFLTEFEGYRFKEGANGWLYMLQIKSTDRIQEVVYKAYDSTGALLHTENVANPYVLTTSSSELMLRIPCGANMANINAALVTGVSYVEIYTYDLVNPTSETFTVYIDGCSKFDQYTVHYLAELGQFESFTFDLVNHEVWNKQDSSYRAINYTVNSTSVNRSMAHHQNRNFANQSTNAWRVNSDWITTEQSTLLRQLNDSPVIYLEIPDGTMVAVDSVRQNTYETKETKFDKLFNLEYTFTSSQLNNRQRW